MSDSPSPTPPPTRSTSPPLAHEEYSFACMRCGFAWETAYDIKHLRGVDGTPLVVYYVQGERVPSPLTHPRCAFCDGTKVRIMEAGKVSALRKAQPWS
ncbi:hypothetical protein [Streptomyces sp. NPDC005438]|uniref:hypothetical protein n=1 Tax=Streptomyces sp. NPDC005438 TaxID=3156880 RepID=UPI00339E7DBA